MQVLGFFEPVLGIGYSKVKLSLALSTVHKKNPMLTFKAAGRLRFLPSCPGSLTVDTSDPSGVKCSQTAPAPPPGTVVSFLRKAGELVDKVGLNVIETIKLNKKQMTTLILDVKIDKVKVLTDRLYLEDKDGHGPGTCLFSLLIQLNSSIGH